MIFEHPGQLRPSLPVQPFVLRSPSPCDPFMAHGTDFGRESPVDDWGLGREMTLYNFSIRRPGTGKERCYAPFRSKLTFCEIRSPNTNSFFPGGAESCRERTESTVNSRGETARDCGAPRRQVDRGNQPLGEQTRKVPAGGERDLTRNLYVISHVL